MSRRREVHILDDSDSETAEELGYERGPAIAVVDATPHDKRARSAPAAAPRDDRPSSDEERITASIGALVSAEARHYSEHGADAGPNAVELVGSILGDCLNGKRTPLSVSKLSKRRPFAAQPAITTLEALGWTRVEDGEWLLPTMFDDSSRQAEAVELLTKALPELQYAQVELQFKQLGIKQAQEQAGAELERSKTVTVVDAIDVDDDGASGAAAAAAVVDRAGTARAAIDVDATDSDAAAARGVAPPTAQAYTVKLIFPVGLQASPISVSGLKASEPLVALFELPQVRTTLGLDRRTNPLADFALVQTSDGRRFTEFETNNFSLLEILDSRSVVLRIEARASRDRVNHKSAANGMQGDDLRRPRDATILRLVEPTSGLASPSLILRDPCGDGGKKLAELIEDSCRSAARRVERGRVEAVSLHGPAQGRRHADYTCKQVYKLADQALDMAQQEVNLRAVAAGFSDTDRGRAYRALKDRLPYSMSSAMVYGEGATLHDHVDGHGWWVVSSFAARARRVSTALPHRPARHAQVLWTLHGTTYFNCGGIYQQLRSGDALVSSFAAALRTAAHPDRPTAPAQIFNGDPRHKFTHGFSFWESPRDWPEGLPAWLARTRVSVQVSRHHVASAPAPAFSSVPLTPSQARMHGPTTVGWGGYSYSAPDPPTRTRITFG